VVRLTVKVTQPPNKWRFLVNTTVFSNLSKGHNGKQAYLKIIFIFTMPPAIWLKGEILGVILPTL
jgi:hypothetical protein